LKLSPTQVFKVARGEVMAKSATPQAKPPITSLVFLVCVSIFAALVTPHTHWRILYAALACYSLVCLIFKFGWLVPCTIIGTHIGVLMDQPIKGMVIGSRFAETMLLIVGCAICGLFAGLMADGPDLVSRKQREDENPNDEPSNDSMNKDQSQHPSF
jgi:hypothetical protein